MNKLKVNLNLLRALDVLLRERNVTNAGKVLHLSQSAMSNALAQCRELFHDELLVRNANGMSLTPQAEHIKERLAPVLKDLEDLVQSVEEFDPASSKRRFVIGFYDHGWASRRVLPPLLELAHQLSPQVQFDIKNLSDNLEQPSTNHGQAACRQHQYLDVIVGFFDVAPSHHMHQELYYPNVVCAARKDHAYFENPDLKTYLASKHLVVSDPYYGQPTYTDKLLEDNHHKSRQIAMRLASVQQAFEVLPRTHYLATLPLDLLEKYAPDNIAYAPTPFDDQRSEAISMIWDERQTNDKAHQWLRELIHGVCQHF